MVTVDISSAFMKVDTQGKGGGDTKLEVTMANLFTKLDPKLYREHVRTEKGKSVLYLRLKKALYGTV